MIPIDLNKIPVERQSALTMILGILTVIIGFFQMLSSWLSYRDDNGTSFLLGVLTLLFGIAFISLGNRKIVDPEYLLHYLRALKKE